MLTNGLIQFWQFESAERNLNSVTVWSFDHVGWRSNEIMGPVAQNYGLQTGVRARRSAALRLFNKTQLSELHGHTGSYTVDNTLV